MSFHSTKVKSDSIYVQRLIESQDEDGKGWGYIDMIDIKMTDKIWSLKKSGIV